ncbi:hypothetical protein C7G42_24260 [Bradyrhizobium sp. MOS003]|nr:hypothetical protein C7G42_24260 [Bradyrhizobium sp. MOS003]
MLRRAGIQKDTRRADGWARLCSAPSKRRCAASGARERSCGAPVFPRHCERKRSNPESLCGKILDCFVARAPRNDGVCGHSASLSCPGRAATLLRCCAEPGPSKLQHALPHGPGSAAHRRGGAALRPGHESGVQRRT